MTLRKRGINEAIVMSSNPRGEDIDKESLDYVTWQYVRKVAAKIARQLPPSFVAKGKKSSSYFSSNSGHIEGEGTNGRGQKFEWSAYVSLRRGNYLLNTEVDAHVVAQGERHQMSFSLRTSQDPTDFCAEVVGWLKRKAGVK